MQFLEVNSATMHYKWIDNKKDKTFLFINSLGTDFRIWDDVVEQLKSYGNILLYDKRGHGLSDMKANAVRNGLQTYLEDVLQLILKLSIERLIVVGISLGGMIAQLLAYKKPELIDKLILCDTGAAIGTSDLWNARINNIKNRGLLSVSEGIINRWFSETYSQTNPVMVEGFRNMLERTLSEGYIKACEVIRDTDLTSTTRQIQSDTLCVVGSEDMSTPPNLVKSLAGLIPKAKFEMINQSGHLPCIDNPKALSKLIIDFIK